MKLKIWEKDFFAKTFQLKKFQLNQKTLFLLVPESSFFSRIDIQNHIVALNVNKKVCFVMFHLSNAPS